MPLPLEGIKVLDLGIAVAVPFGAAMLSDMGAEVTKVERVQGEVTRQGLPAGIDDMLDTCIVGKMPDKADWMAFNRGKKDIAIDIRFSGFAKYLTDGELQDKMGRSYEAPPLGPIKAKDGDIMTIFGNGSMWPAFCKNGGNRTVNKRSQI